MRTEEGIKEHLFQRPWFRLCPETFQGYARQLLFEKGKSLYEWTKATLQDTTDCLYFDNMRLDGEIGRAKFAYNSGQMMQSAALLYQLTGNGQYLKDAQAIAAACHNYFFMEFTPGQGEPFRMLKKGDVWFTAVMLRGL